LRSQCVDVHEWKSIVAHIRQHRVYALMLQDPYTLRATQKPRGYPGDALLLDFVYRHPLIERDVQQSSALGKRIYEYTGVDSPPAMAVRNRRDLIASILRSAAGSASIRLVLAFACGHLREFDAAFPHVHSPFCSVRCLRSTLRASRTGSIMLCGPRRNACDLHSSAVPRPWHH
jgi:hypothetical protein